MWASGAKDETLSFLRHFSASLARDIQAESTAQAQRAGVSRQKLDELSRLLARCYFKQGDWQVELKDSWDEVSVSMLQSKRADIPQRNIDDILHCYMLATHFDPTWYKAWHTWALANFNVIAHMENQNDNRVVDIPGKGLAAHTVQAVEGALHIMTVLFHAQRWC
jgi:FKBP12-rapamycin complex-associated protein